MELRLDASELAVYVGSAVLAALVFAVAMFLMSRRGAVPFSTRQTVGLTVGFTLFMGSYFAAMFLWDWLHGDSQQ